MNARFGAFTVRVDCAQCGQPVPLNAPTERAHCAMCTGDFPVPLEIFSRLLHRFEEHYPAVIEPGILAAQQAHTTTRVSEPACVACRALLDVPRLSAGAVTAIPCSACGEEAAGFPVPPWLRDLVPSAAFVVITDTTAAPGRDLAAPARDASHPIALPCPQCGAALHVTGDTERSVLCHYCKTDVYLPDDLWRRLHPVKTVSPWFVCFEGPTHAVLEGERRARDEEARRKASARADLAAMDEAAAREVREAPMRARRWLVKALCAALLGGGAFLALKKIASHPADEEQAMGERLARADLLQTPQRFARRFSGELAPGGHEVRFVLRSGSGTAYTRRLEVRWDPGHEDHPNDAAMNEVPNFTNAGRPAAFLRLPGGLNEWGIWSNPHARLQFDKTSQTTSFHVDADDARDPIWRQRADTAWKLVFNAAFGTLEPTVGELAAFVGDPRP